MRALHVLSILYLSIISDYSVFTRQTQNNIIPNLEYNINSQKNDSLALEIMKRGNAKADRGDYQGAFADYNKTIELAPLSASPHICKAITRAYLKDYKGAIEDYNKAITLDPKRSEAYYGRGLSKGRLGDTNGEIEDYQTALKYDSLDFDTYFNLGIALYEIGRQAEAASIYAVALEKCDVDYDFFNNYGRVLYDLERFAEAVKIYTIGIKRFQNDGGRMLYSRGLAKQQAGDKIGAAHDWIESVKQGCDEARILLPLADKYLSEESRKK